MFEKEIEKLKELQNDDDVENAHSTADAILCEILEQLGYTKIVDEYCKITKWYA